MLAASRLRDSIAIGRLASIIESRSSKSFLRSLSSFDPVHRNSACSSSADCFKAESDAPHRHTVHEPPRSAYVHLPFCKRRCFYCDFPIQAVGSDPEALPVQNTIQQYIDVLCREIESTNEAASSGLETIFFGGGTPSLVPPELLAEVLSCLNEKYRICTGAEISMEADPGTFTAERLRDYMSLGVNRFSVGIQAFQQDILEACGRSHGLHDVHKAIEDIHRAGVSSWSLDLISGLPHSSLDAWRHSLEEALKAEPTHISVYDLQVEDGTKFGRMYAPGQFPLPTDDNTAAMFCMASDILKRGGLEHYEISSYALPGHRCKHNQIYWSGKSYLAFGLGASSYVDGRRVARPKSMTAYKRWVAELESHEGKTSGTAKLDTLSLSEQLLDMVMLRLRLKDGLNLKEVAALHGNGKAATILEALSPHLARKLVTHDSDTLALQDPDGFLRSNDIISDVFARLDQD